jgi:hypothetical protein
MMGSKAGAAATKPKRTAVMNKSWSLISCSGLGKVLGNRADTGVKE